MGEVRMAGADDAEELVRLRAVMLASMDGTDVPPGQWSVDAITTLRTGLPGSAPTMAAFVVDAPDGARLAACALGFIQQRLASPGNPSGVTGYVGNVVTDPGYRRRGYARACMEALLAWFAERGITRIDLNASAAGEPLYASLGFRPSRSPAMRLTR